MADPSGSRPKITTASLRAMKAAGERIAMLTAYDHLFAGLLDQAGIDVVLVGDSVATVMQGRDTTVPVTMDQIVYHCELVGRGVERALVVGDMPFLSYQVSVEDALRNAGRLLKEGLAEAVKLEGGAAYAGTVAALVGAGIPVMGHLGLTPQSIHQFGSYKARGIEPAERERILADARALADAGAFAIVLEKVPAELGAAMQQAVPIPILGIGAGPHVDGQVLVTHDMLGLFTRFRPRFARRYLELADEIGKAVASYCADVRSGGFPSDEESY
ncbi:MAG: 3-methyl-2-oxobutanoate hydroxymethyltransferase [Planctomycetes bacterium]|nr:3-methyl-2-oxobutanoate hydroxymethyltransferase [Planctomycetota bacterium]